MQELRTDVTVHAGGVEKVKVAGVSYLRTDPDPVSPFRGAGKPFHVLRLGPVTFHFDTRTEMQRFAVDTLRAAFNPVLQP